MTDTPSCGARAPFSPCTCLLALDHAGPHACAHALFTDAGGLDLWSTLSAWPWPELDQADALDQARRRGYRGSYARPS